MYQYKNIDDTIVAISTPLGQGGIGIVRLSGPAALQIADKIFCSKNKVKPSKARTFTVHYGWIVDSFKKDNNKKVIIDEVLLTVMRAPKSYTKEDVVEISCHGGIVSLKSILKIIIDCGARLAEPGEFTKRAFLNGRIDLTQAEAVLDIIQAKTEAFLKVSTNQLKGELSQQLDMIREHLMSVYTELEVALNFPEEGLEVIQRKELYQKIKKAKAQVDILLMESEEGTVLKEGIKIVICGKPNVGKSSLLNVLLKQPRAIVSKIAGTTRDTIEELAQIKGIPFQIVDTAGILTPRGIIEKEATKRSHSHIKGADIVLLVLDASRRLSKEDSKLLKKVKTQNVIVVLNKGDLKQLIKEEKIIALLPKAEVVTISALKKKNIHLLEEKIVSNVMHGKAIDTKGILISNLRHIEALNKCQKSLESAIALFADGLSFEFVCEEIKIAVKCLDNITGRDIDGDLLDKIFSQFCIGK